MFLFAHARIPSLPNCNASFLLLVCLSCYHFTHSIHHLIFTHTIFTYSIFHSAHFHSTRLRWEFALVRLFVRLSLHSFSFHHPIFTHTILTFSTFTQPNWNESFLLFVCLDWSDSASLALAISKSLAEAKCVYAQQAQPELLNFTDIMHIFDEYYSCEKVKN